ncbi:hypothetical protein OCC_14485 [Thermococcus litoralis DSM 5473]|uniref:Uncharacterized protein n=1 Tax=Thermococcus litoralis (strain ATCC 51850 / DSM 5473 / JCM 8560 / NS-C) TaxID=523849 RepID=S5ZIN8_THELN|nr:hypothetical protein OCC_14485 [Thermococcus litoralis DSM 5473]
MGFLKTFRLIVNSNFRELAYKSLHCKKTPEGRQSRRNFPKTASICGIPSQESFLE